MEFKVPVPPSGQYTYFPGTSPVPERSAANTHAVSYKILADVETEIGTEGIIFAQGARIGGHALYVKDGKIRYAYNFLGIKPVQLLEAPLPEPGRHVIGVEFVKQRSGEYNESYGPATLYVDETQVASSEIRTMSGHFSICGEGLCIGYDSSDPVTTDYHGRFDYRGGQIHKVVFDVADDAYIDVERHLHAAMSRD
jgi:arylsulfatase